jgi:hypothetical protein
VRQSEVCGFGLYGFYAGIGLWKIKYEAVIKAKLFFIILGSYYILVPVAILTFYNDAHF